LILIGLLFAWPRAQSAQTQEPTPSSEIRQLEQRLQQLEQNVVELKTQLESIAGTKKKSDAAIGEKAAEPANVATERLATLPATSAQSDEPANQEQYLKVYQQYGLLWKLLTPEASEKVHKENYARIFDKARRKVRSWEATHVK
jgi:predicted  nucleic acid-binding Zn-ribbon protein